jgi:hypothetical protein
MDLIGFDVGIDYVSPAPQFMGTCGLHHSSSPAYSSWLCIIALCSSINTTTFFSLCVRCYPVKDLKDYTILLAQFSTITGDHRLRILTRSSNPRRDTPLKANKFAHVYIHSVYSQLTFLSTLSSPLPRTLPVPASQIQVPCQSSNVNA